MASKHIHVVLDAELEEALRSRAEANGITVSAEARDLLRRAVGTVKTERQAGWWEGYFAAKAELYRAVGTAVTELITRATAATAKKRRAA